MLKREGSTIARVAEVHEHGQVHGHGRVQRAGAGGPLREHELDDEQAAVVRQRGAGVRQQRPDRAVEGGLAGPHGVLELAPGHVGLAAAVEGEVAQRPRRAGPQQRAHLGQRDPVLGVQRDQPESGQAQARHHVGDLGRA
jgi:hypothetical protein